MAHGECVHSRGTQNRADPWFNRSTTARESGPGLPAAGLAAFLRAPCSFLTILLGDEERDPGRIGQVQQSLQISRVRYDPEVSAPWRAPSLLLRRCRIRSRLYNGTSIHGERLACNSKWSQKVPVLLE